MTASRFEKLLADIDTVSTENELSLSIDAAAQLAGDLNPQECEQLFLALRTRLVYLVIQKGVLPHSDILRLFPLFRKHIHANNDAAIENHINLLKKHLSAIPRSSHEYFLFVGLIFVLEMFNTEFEMGFRGYLARMITSNVFEAYKYPEAYALFKNILGYCEIAPEEMMEYLAQMLEADNFFQNDSEAQSSILIWIMTVIWGEQRYLASPSFFKLENPFADILKRALELENVALAMQLYNVAHHILGNLFQTQQEMADFGERFTRVLSRKYVELSESLPKPASKTEGKKKIAIVRDRLVANSPHMVEYSLIQLLMEDTMFIERYKLYVYSVGYVEKGLDDEKIIRAYEQLGVEVKVVPLTWYPKGYYYDQLEKAKMVRDDMIRERIDIMIGTVGNNNIIDFLFATRSAPHQIYWSHGNHQYDIDGLDQRISHINKASPYPFSFFKSNTLDVFLKGGGESDQYKKRALEIRAAYGEDTLIFGSIGRLIKIDNDDYILAVAQSLKKYPNSIYLACGLGNIDSIKEKFDAFGVGERLFFPGFVDPHEYGYVLDIYLNTFPETGGESVNEFLSKGEDKYLVSYVDSVERYVKDVDVVMDYINYIKTEKKEEIGIPLALADKTKLCTDRLTCAEDADLIIYLLNKHAMLVYLIQEDNLNEMETYVMENVPIGKVQKVRVDTVFEYVDLADLYIFMDNYQLRNLMLWKKKKIVLWNAFREKIDGNIKNIFSKINQDYVSMSSLSQILNIDPKLFQDQDSIYKLFGIMCAQGGLNQAETELFWNSPDNSIDRNKFFFDLIILHEPLRKIFQEYIYLNCSEIYKENTLKSNAAEFITLLEEKN